MASIEEKVEEHYKKILDELGIRHYGKTESKGLKRKMSERRIYMAYITITILLLNMDYGELFVSLLF